MKRIMPAQIQIELLRALLKYDAYTSYPRPNSVESGQNTAFQTAWEKRRYRNR